jgi:transposase
LDALNLKFDKSLQDKPLLLFFQDEGRFGRINTLQRCWGPINDRPIVCKQLIRQYTYAYTAVCPSTGETFSLILPYANSDSMKIFIKEMSKAYPNNRIAMIMDNASWHKNEEKIYPKNIKPIFLPPRAPELNPVENIWHYIKEKFFNNRIFKSIEKVEKKLCDVLSGLNDNKNIIKNIANYHWLSA